MANRWILPEGIDERLPPETRRVERVRRRLLDRFDAWGYELIDPPLIEYLDSLLVGAGSDLVVQTIQTADPRSGRTLGFRADITSQAARIDAHSLAANGLRRLCYVGPVVHARPRGVFASRTPVRIGAELYGHAGPESDAEIVQLMDACVRGIGVADSHVEIGHLGLFRALVEPHALDPRVRDVLFEAVQAKSAGDLRAAVASEGVDARLAERLVVLTGLVGDAAVVEHARAELVADLDPATADAVARVLGELAALLDLLRQRAPDLRIHLDLGELRGLRYHTGLVYTAYADDASAPLARGGRYDGLGQPFGADRPATGFDADLHELARLAEQSARAGEQGLFAPRAVQSAPGFWNEVARLRTAGVRVVVQIDESVPSHDGTLEYTGDGFVERWHGDAAKGV